jgi:NhaP-type Na+/H+ or K+/H+ antiporter
MRPGAPLVLARVAPPAVCFLIRPESLLSDPLALELLRAAISFAAGVSDFSTS